MIRRKRLQTKIARRILVFLFLFKTSAIHAAEVPTSHDPDIDAVRKEVRNSPTTADNYRKRSLLMFLWLSALQQQGADTHTFFDADKLYYQSENAVLGSQGEAREDALRQMARAIDAGFAVLEEIQRKLDADGPIYQPFTADPTTAPLGGDLEADWPQFQCNIHNTGHTTAPGPKTGRLAWKSPVGLGWYARPVVENGRVYVASPGMKNTSLCIDLESGAEIWKSTQSHPLFGIYKYPAIMSTPVLLGDRVVLREVNSHGGNEGQARNLVYLDKQTGKTLARKFAGHVDYRTQVAPLAGNGSFVVYPFGVADIYGSPAICQNFNRLICADANNEKQLWDFNVGDIDALAEPVMTDDRVLQGTSEGYLYALNLAGPQSERIAWKFHADGAIHTAVARHGGRIFFGSNGGAVFARDENNGSLLWKTPVGKIEPRTRKQFTVPLVHDGRIYIGSADRGAYCLDASNGKILWMAEMTDWVRAMPALTSEGLIVAAVDGTVTCLGKEDGGLKWRKKISTHPIYADLVAAGDSVLVNDSDLWLRRVGKGGEVLWKRSLLQAFEDKEGRRIFTDVLSGGTYYQSKPTAVKGRVFYGMPSGFLVAADADTGKELWKFEMGGAISVAPAVADGRVFAGQQGGERFFYCVDAENGAPIWKQTIPGGWVWGSATVDEGRVYIPTVDGHAVCLDAATGHIIWSYPTAMSVPAEPAIDGGLVYFGSWSHSIYAFDKKTGDIIWKENGVGLDSGTLIATGGKVYLPHHRNIFSTLDAKTGATLSTGILDPKEKGRFSNFNATPALHDGRAYYTARIGEGLRGVPTASRVYCVDLKRAKVLWTFPDGGGLSAPAIANGRVYIGSGNTPLLYCLDAATGKPLWIHRLGQRVEEATLCIYRDKAIVLAGDGWVHAIK
ncbi:MAG: PQQ-binding-like beta-propeller repeat protein [Luteolibacter sp.]